MVQNPFKRDKPKHTTGSTPCPCGDDEFHRQAREAARASPPKVLAESAVATWEKAQAGLLDQPDDWFEDFYRVSKAYLELEKKLNDIAPFMARAKETTACLSEFTERFMAIKEKWGKLL